MDEREARAFLSLHRVGDPGIDDARLEEARRAAEFDPELAKWWNEEQELDRAIAAKLANVAVAADLKARLNSSPQAHAVAERSWRRIAALAAAAVITLAVLVGTWRRPFQPAPSLADYREEMVSFIKVTPSLELETPELARVKDFLAKSEAPAHFSVPPKLQNYQPVGCRVLRFRGHDVSLICFNLGKGKLAHLFIVDGAAVRGPASPLFASEGMWTTTTWREGNDTYLLAVPGDRAEADKFLNNS